MLVVPEEQLQLIVKATFLYSRQLDGLSYYMAGYNQLDGNNNFGDPRNVMFSVKYTPTF